MTPHCQHLQGTKRPKSGSSLRSSRKGQAGLKLKGLGGTLSRKALGTILGAVLAPSGSLRGSKLPLALAFIVFVLMHRSMTRPGFATDVYSPQAF